MGTVVAPTTLRTRPPCSLARKPLTAMKKYKSLAYVAALAVLAASTAACQRGYGCPTDLSAAADVLALTNAAQPAALR